MEKADFLKTRVSPKLKSEFDDICAALDKQASVQLRELVENFVHTKYSLLEDRLAINIHKPDDYDFGAWRITMKLRNPDELTWNGAAVPFDLPDLPNRLLSSDPEYRAVVINPKADFCSLGGKFVNGEWRGHLYSNGCPESENPTPVSQVRDTLQSTINMLLDRFSGRDSPSPRRITR